MSARESPRRLHPLAYRRADERPSPFTVRYDDLAWHILQWPADTVDELREVDVAKTESPARSRYGERLRPSAGRRLRPAPLVRTSGVRLESRSRPVELGSIRYGIREHRNQHPATMDDQAGRRFIRCVETGAGSALLRTHMSPRAIGLPSSCGGHFVHSASIRPLAIYGWNYQGITGLVDLCVSFARVLRPLYKSRRDINQESRFSSA